MNGGVASEPTRAVGREECVQRGNVNSVRSLVGAQVIVDRRTMGNGTAAGYRYTSYSGQADRPAGEHIVRAYAWGSIAIRSRLRPWKAPRSCIYRANHAGPSDTTGDTATSFGKQGVVITQIAEGEITRILPGPGQTDLRPDRNIFVNRTATLDLIVVEEKKRILDTQEAAEGRQRTVPDAGKEVAAAHSIRCR